MNGRALVAAWALAAGLAAPAWGIGNGIVAGESEYPYVAAVDVVDPMFYRTVGSGFLIAPDWVLTAAHVIDRPLDDDERFTLRFGDERYEVTSIIPHPDYVETDDVPSDMALVRLDREVEGVTPAMLIDHRAMGLTLAAEEVTMAGYGATSNNVNDAGTLRYGQAQIADAQDNYYYTMPGGAVAYGGDSGGPSLLYDGRQDGVVGIHHAVVSFGSISTDFNYDIVVSDYRSFIDTHVTGVTWGLAHYRTPEGPAQWARWTVTQGTSEFKGQGDAKDLISLAGDGPTAHPLGVWQVIPLASDLESWAISFYNFDQDNNDLQPIDATQPFTVELSDIDWVGYDPIHGVPRSLLQDVAALTLFDLDGNVIYSGELAVSLIGDTFLSASFLPGDLVSGLTSFSHFTLGDIMVMAVPEPGTAACVVVGLAFACRRPRRDAGHRSSRSPDFSSPAA